MSEETQIEETPVDQGQEGNPNPAPEGSQEGGEGQGGEPQRKQFTGVIPYKRFQEVARQKAQFKAERDALAQRIQELETRNAPRQEDDFPDPAKFDSLESYKAAVRDHAKAQGQRVAESHVQQSTQSLQQQNEVAKIVHGFNSRMTSMIAEAPHIVEAVEIFKSLESEMDPRVFRDIVADEDGPRIALAIAEDPDFADALLSASPVQAGKLIAKRLAQTSIAPAAAGNQTPTPQTPAARPTPTVRGGKTAAPPRTLAEIAARGSQEDFEKALAAGIR